MKGLEPPRLSASDPKSDVATNYTTSATLGFCSWKNRVFLKSSAKVTIFLIITTYGGENFIKFTFFALFAPPEHTSWLATFTKYHTQRWKISLFSKNILYISGHEKCYFIDKIYRPKGKSAEKFKFISEFNINFDLQIGK